MAGGRRGSKKVLWTAAGTLSALPGMNVTQRPVLTDDQRRLLDGVQVRLLQPGDRARFDQLLIEQR